VKSNLNQNSSDILHRNRKINPKVHIEGKKTSHIQNNSEQKEQW
jgi:hypothetical protein